MYKSQRGYLWPTVPTVHCGLMLDKLRYYYLVYGNLYHLMILVSPGAWYKAAAAADIWFLHTNVAPGCRSPHFMDHFLGVQSASNDRKFTVTIFSIILRCQDITEGHCNNKNLPSNCFSKVSVMLQIITVTFILVFWNYNSLSNTKHIVIFIKLSSYTKMTFLIQFLQYKTKDRLINSQYMTRN